MYRVLNFARQWIDGPLLAASVDDGTPVRKALFEFCSQLLGKQTTKQSLSEVRHFARSHRCARAFRLKLWQKLILWRRRYTNLEQPDVAGRDHFDSCVLWTVTRQWRRLLRVVDDSLAGGFIVLMRRQIGRPGPRATRGAADLVPSKSL